MPHNSLEERVAALERQMAELMAERKRSTETKDWRRTVGMFSGDEAMKAIDAAGQALREKERQKARRQKTKRRRVSP
jgi:hypothetical protein